MVNKENYNEILDLKLDLNVNLGSIHMKISDIVNLEKGSIIDLNTPAGDNAQLYVNNKIIGNGEIIVYEKNLAIRVNEVLDEDKLISEGIIL